MMNARMAFMAACIFSCMHSSEQTWVHRNFSDLSAGEPGASGQNLYISARGGLRTIRRFDLDRNGYIDLMFNSTHDDDVAVPATLAMVSPGGQWTYSELPVPGSLSAAVADLNRDGDPDIVYCPNSSGAQTPHRYVSVAYGGKDGWPGSRQNGLLPVHEVKSVAVADLNHDQWPDIVTLNGKAWLPGQPDGNILRIYWGDPHGFILHRFLDIGIEKAFQLVSGDLDADGAGDITCLRPGNKATLLWGRQGFSGDAAGMQHIDIPGKEDFCVATCDIDRDGNTDLIAGSDNGNIYTIKGEKGRRWSAPALLAGMNASSISTGDIDMDGHTDLAVSYFSQKRAAGGERLGGRETEDDRVRIIWGGDEKNGTRVTQLDAPYTTATAITDLDSDGRMDVVCARHQGAENYSTVSPVFLGRGGRNLERSQNTIPTHGAFHVAVLPTGKTSPAAVVISNSKKGTLNEAVPLYLYYGGPQGFSKDRRLEIPFSSGYESSAADLNDDGYADLIAINSMHGGQQENPLRGVNIFWGSQKGFDQQNRRTVLNEDNASTSNVADFNKDGHLDIAVGFFDHQDGRPTELVIHYGSEKGFLKENRKAIPCEGRSASPTIGDFDKDGWLDIAVSSFSKDMIRIFHGARAGFTAERQSQIHMPGIIDLETADLNNDGYLDLIASSYKDKVNDHHDSGVMLFWGSVNGFREWNAQWLPSATVLGPLAADFDSDGHLDLFLPSYHGDHTRENLPMYLYWGSKDGFSEGSRKVFTGNSGADALAADFNRDGLLDLAIADHATNKAHSTVMSHVHYNDGKRFSTRDHRVEEIPSPGCHWMWNYDLGNIYHRRTEETYSSGILKLAKGVQLGRIEHESEIDGQAKLAISVRTGATAETVGSAPWEDPRDGTFPVPKGHGFLQYRLKLISLNGDSYPAVNKVTVTVK